MNNLIEITKLNKVYKQTNNDELKIFDNLNINIVRNSITSILGPSGCGKSTLLNILGLLDSTYNGKYFFNGQIVNKMSKNKLSIIRNQNIGLIHQFFHLIPELNVFENIILPALINSNDISSITEKAKNLLKTFEIYNKKDMKPNKLSGGEQQRIAIARSLINNPNLILADEITGNLDEKTADDIMNFLLNFINKNKISLIFVTHNTKYARMANNQYELKNRSLTII